MNYTLEHIRALVLLCARAFGGKRGRSGIINFLTGEASSNTLDIARESGIAELFNALNGFSYQEIQQTLINLERNGMVETVNVKSGDKTLPLIQVTNKGIRELDRLQPTLPLQGATKANADKVLQVFTKLGKLITALRAVELVDLPSRMAITEAQLRQYVQLLCKVLQLRPEAVLATTHSRQHFATMLERSLCTAVFAELSEVEAQCLRAYTGISLKHQLDRESLGQYYDVKSPEDKARQAAARVASREWQAKNQLVSVLGFLSLGEGL